MANADADAPRTLRAAAAAADMDIPEGITLAPVSIDGQVLFQVRGSESFPAAARADAIAARIVAVARDRAVSPAAVKLEERPLGTAIVAGSQTLVTVLELDARVEGIDRPLLAQVQLEQITQAVVRYRSDREPRALLRGAGVAAAASVVLALVLWGLWRLRRLIDTTLERRYRARLEHLQIAGFKILHAEQLWGGLRSAVAAVFWLLTLAASYLALDFALLQFPGTRGLAVELLGLFLKPLAEMGRGLVASIPSLVFLLMLVLVTRYVLQTLRLLFGAIEQGSVKLKGFDTDWTWPTYRIVRLLVLAFAVVVAFPYVPGSSSDAFKGVSLFLGIIFSLGSTSIIANIIAGYSMTYRRAFRVGDRIKVGDIVGEVTEVRLQVTHVRSLKNEDVVVPNSVILNSAVVNYSTLAASQGLILHTTVGIGYETPWRQVEAMLLMAAERTPRVLKEPAPFVLQKSLGDFAVNYELNAHINLPGEMNSIYTELHRQILDVFNEYGVAIMTPAYESDPEQPKVVPKDQWYAAPAKR
ncbi:MAG: mechanosensitive ion channel family protein [Rubrivivax sp.]|nr:mechanosensitive ion channel family protein [Rubrivivax sp.]